MKSENLVKIEKALAGSLGAFEALELVGADKYLPGHETCKKEVQEALKIVEGLHDEI
jgi:hypothetical protein